MSAKRIGCSGQPPQYSKGSEGTGKSNGGQKNRQRGDGDLVEGVKGLSIRREPGIPLPKASTGVRKGGVKKVTGRAREGYQHAPPAPRGKLGSTAIPFEIRLIINSPNADAGQESWALFLHRNGRDKILSDVVGGLGDYQYREQRGVDPDPNNQLKNMHVADLEPRHLARYVEILASTPVNMGSSQWAMGTVHYMIQQGMIHIVFHEFSLRAWDY
jgi:hypothetical protein